EALGQPVYPKNAVDGLQVAFRLFLPSFNRMEERPAKVGKAPQMCDLTRWADVAQAGRRIGLQQTSVLRSGKYLVRSFRRLIGLVLKPHRTGLAPENPQARFPPPSGTTWIGNVDWSRVELNVPAAEDLHFQMPYQRRHPFLKLTHQRDLAVAGQVHAHASQLPLDSKIREVVSIVGAGDVGHHARVGPRPRENVIWPGRVHRRRLQGARE